MFTTIRKGTFSPRVILYIFSSIFLIYGGLGIGVGVLNFILGVGLLSLWGFSPVLWGLLGSFGVWTLFMNIAE